MLCLSGQNAQPRAKTVVVERSSRLIYEGGGGGEVACSRPNSNARAAQSKIILRVEEESLAIQPSIGLGSVATLSMNCAR